MKISFNNFQKQYLENKVQIDQAITRVLASGHYILGPEVKNFEQKFSEYLGSKHTIGVANGLEALQISLLALGIGQGDEIITTAHSAVATALAITNVGATPVFCDIDEFYHLDTSLVEEKITSKTKAIIPVHLYGQSADIDALIEIATKHKIHLIEDCAQAHGSTWNDKKVGTFGTFGCFSFYPTKNLGGVGDGGAIVTDSDTLAEKCRMLRNYGQKNRYEHEVRGINSRLDEIQAAILSVLLQKLDNNNSRRREIAALYMKELKDVPQIKLPLIRKQSGHVFHLYVIQAERRDDLQKYLEKQDIQTLIHYPIPIHKQKCFAEYADTSLPRLEDAVSNILSLPAHPYLTDEEVGYVCNMLRSFYAQ